MEVTAINILDHFQKISYWKFRAAAEELGLEVKEWRGNEWKPLKSVKGNFENYHEPIFLYDKIDGNYVKSGIGMFKKL